MAEKKLKLVERDIVAQVVPYLTNRGWRAVRMQRTVMPGQFQAGEPGMPDYLFLRYLAVEGSVARGMLWIEFKGPNDKRKCKCKGVGRKCTICAQAEWKRKEQIRGGTVLEVSDLDAFIAWYERGERIAA